MNVEQLLRSAAANADWPATPDIASAIERHTSADPALNRARARITAGSMFGWRRPLALAFAVLLIACGSAAAVPGIREPVLDWLGLRSVHIERVPRALPEGPGARLALGRRTTLAAARPRLGFAPLVPNGLGSPAVYYDAFPPGGALSLVYRNGHVLLTELQGKLVHPFFFKFIRPGTRVDRVRIAGGRGLWIHGELHQYGYADRTGRLLTDSVRTAGDVLLWRHGDLLLRLEGARSKPAALRIARSARATP